MMMLAWIKSVPRGSTRYREVVLPSALPQKSDLNVNLTRASFLNLRSRCKRKAWDVSPRKPWFQIESPRMRAKVERRQELSPVITGCLSWSQTPGAHAPAFMLAPASQAEETFEAKPLTSYKSDC